MKINEKYEPTVWGMLGIVAAVAVVVGGGTWALATKLQSDELEGYRKAKDWKVKDAIETIEKVSNQVALNTNERGELLKLRVDNVSFEKTISEMKLNQQIEVSKLTDQIKSLEKSTGDLRNTLGSIVKETNSFEVPKGEARFVVPKTIAIGVESTFDSFASVRIGDASATSMHPGEKLTVNLGTKVYAVTLMKISKESCTFAFGEIEKSK